MRMRCRSGRVIAAVMLIASPALMVHARAADAGSVGAASQPSQPSAGPGSDGRCGVRSSMLRNPRAPQSAVYLYEPTGTAPAKVAPGRCNGARRPAVFIAHGVNASDPSSYAALVHHLVSAGNVVVYPTYSVSDGNKATIEEAYRVVDAGIVAAVRSDSRIDTTRVGWWGHSMGGSMIAYLVQQGGLRRGWGRNGIWMSNVAQTYALL